MSNDPNLNDDGTPAQPKGSPGTPENPGRTSDAPRDPKPVHEDGSRDRDAEQRKHPAT